MGTSMNHRMMRQLHLSSRCVHVPNQHIGCRGETLVTESNHYLYFSLGSVSVFIIYREHLLKPTTSHIPVGVTHPTVQWLALNLLSGSELGEVRYYPSAREISPCASLSRDDNPSAFTSSWVPQYVIPSGIEGSLHFGRDDSEEKSR